MADDQEGAGPVSHLTATGEAVVRRIPSDWESHLTSTMESRIPAARQSQIIHDCMRICSQIMENADDEGQPHYPVSMDRAASLILDTLLILQDKRPPQPRRVCIGRRDGCRQRVSRSRRRHGAKPNRTLEVLITLRQPAGSFVVNSISIFPVIRLENHTRLCSHHEKMVEATLTNVLVTKAVKKEINAQRRAQRRRHRRRRHRHGRHRNQAHRYRRIRSWNSIRNTVIAAFDDPLN